MSKQLAVIHQDAKLALAKSKSLLNITNKILEDKDSKWLDLLLDWADKNIIQERTSFPSNKDDLKKIKKISLRWNRLKALPKEFFNLSQLEILELNNNTLEFLPNEIGNLTSLRELNLNINSFKALPMGIITLKKMKVLNIKNNKYLELNNEQIGWLEELKQNGCIIIYDKYKYKFNLGE
jgi:Leucine-rich repeat (LRR) protein